MDGTASEPPVSDREFLLRHAKDFRDLAATSHEENIRSALLQMAEEFGHLAQQSN